MNSVRMAGTEARHRPPRAELRTVDMKGRLHMLFLIVTCILFLPIVLFALSNTEIVHLGLWPTGYGIDAPISLTILIAMALAFLLGAVVVWISELSQRRRARRAERTVKLLEAQIEDLKARAMPPLSLPPAA